MEIDQRAERIQDVPRPQVGSPTARVPVRTGELDRDGEPVVEMTVEEAQGVVAGSPARSSVGHPRTIGPGRIEGRYLKRIAALERRQEASEVKDRRLARELEAAHLVERGSMRLLDRMEDRLEKNQTVERRLILALGALQQENTLLVRQVARLEAPRSERNGGRLGLLGRWLRRPRG
jgi:hypothetical protein